MSLSKFIVFDKIHSSFSSAIETYIQSQDINLSPGKLIGNITNSNIRFCNNHDIGIENWISGTLFYYIKNLNDVHFQYDIDGMSSVEYISYKENQHYKWHVDSYSLNEKSCRKLSFVFLLSDYDEYEGGNLQFLSDNGKLLTAPRKKNSLIIFDSRMRHRVRKVTSGERKVIVGWCYGPNWK